VNCYITGECTTGPASDCSVSMMGYYGKGSPGATNHCQPCSNRGTKYNCVTGFYMSGSICSGFGTSDTYSFNSLYTKLYSDTKQWSLVWQTQNNKNKKQQHNNFPNLAQKLLHHAVITKLPNYCFQTSM